MNALISRREETRHWCAVFLATIVGMTILFLLELTDFDRALARISYEPTAGGFALRNNRLLLWTSHDAVKGLAILVFVWIAAGIWRPLGSLRRLPRTGRIYIVIAMLVCLVVVALMKRASALHCPWDLAEFGGTLPYVRLFDALPAGWRGGGCFPAGHVLSSLAFIGGYFAWWPVDRRIAHLWLAAVLALGAWAGIAQQVRGAHFMSHTLWSLWWCWTLSAVLAWFIRDRLRPLAPTPASEL